MKLTVIPEQKLVILNEEAQFVEEVAGLDFVAFHWEGTCGRIEKEGAQGLYEEAVQDESMALGYKKLWDAAKAAQLDEVVDIEFSERMKRDGLLAATDWTQFVDVNMEDSARVAWQEYRELLREVPQQEGFPDSIEWPDLPS